MKLFDTLLGRTKPVQPNLDSLFSLPPAAIELEARMGMKPKDQAAVCFKPTNGQAFNLMQQDLDSLLNLDAKENNTKLSELDDKYGFHWVIITNSSIEDLVTRTHLVNSTLEGQGFGPQLLCSVFSFEYNKKTAYLVYLYKRGSFYPFVPLANEHRDSEMELQIKAALESEIKMESDLSRWFPLWGIPIG